MIKRERIMIDFKKAFTLAEVLIVVSIIGIIAQATIPTLVQNVQEKTTIAQLKKAYSTLSQAYTMAVNENGTPDNWALGGTEATAPGAEEIMNKFTPYLKVLKQCNAIDKSCFPNTVYKYVSGASLTNLNDLAYMARAQLADGSLFSTYSYGNCTTYDMGSTLALKNTCATLMIDVNGYKNPNQLGVDLFAFYLTKYGIIPFGTSSETSYSFSNSCKKTSGEGYGCTAWVLYNENLDYLKCNDLAWTTKTKCN